MFPLIIEEAKLPWTPMFGFFHAHDGFFSKCKRKINVVLNDTDAQNALW